MRFCYALQYAIVTILLVTAEIIITILFFSHVVSSSFLDLIVALINEIFNGIISLVIIRCDQYVYNMILKCVMVKIL